MTICIRLIGCLAGALVGFVLVNATPTSAEELFKVKAAVTVPGKPLNSFDISFVDSTIGLYALGDRTNNAVDLVDTHSNSFISLCGHGQFQGAVVVNGKLVNDISGPDGVLIRDHREIWVGDGDSSVKVFDAAGCNENSTPTHVISTVRAPGTAADDKRADEMCYDPRDQLIMVANNAADPPYGNLISTKTYTVVSQIPFDGTNNAPKATNGAEQCQWSPRTGNFYITIPGVESPDNGHGVVAVISPQTQSVVATFDIPLANCATPQGMAVGPDHQLLIGCNTAGSATQSSVIIDDRKGRIIATIANESGPDEVWFNPGNNHYFLARSGAVGPNQLLGVIDAGHPGKPARDPDGIIATTGAPNSHSVAADSVTGKTFVPIGGGKATCSTAGGTDSQGCIAIFQAPSDRDDRNCFVAGTPVIEVSDDGPKVLRRDCDEDHDRN